MLIFLDGVRQDIDQAVEYYDSQQVGLADEFLEALDAVYAEIETAPLRNPRVDVRGVGKDYHFCLLSRFPYQVIYRSIAGDIEVAAVAHTSRRTGYWRGRIG